MEPGRELDALVAEKVMGVTFKKEWLHISDTCPRYSTSIEAAWQVVKKMKEQYAIEIHIRGGAYGCNVEAGDEVTSYFVATSEADTAPLAICLASLKAVGYEVEK